MWFPSGKKFPVMLCQFTDKQLKGPSICLVCLCAPLLSVVTHCLLCHLHGKNALWQYILGATLRVLVTKITQYSGKAVTVRTKDVACD
jgi:hypothetical protein